MTGKQEYVDLVDLKGAMQRAHITGERASQQFTKLLGIVHGGLGVTLAAWLQRLFEASTDHALSPLAWYNRIKFKAGQARRAEILAILERYNWREPLAMVPPAKVIRELMSGSKRLSLRAVQWHMTELARVERERLRTRNLSRELICVE